MGAVTPRPYVLVCPLCGRRQEDDGLALSCPEPHGPALLQTRYEAERLTVAPGAGGLFRYRSWLPVVRDCPEAGGTVVFRDEKLGRILGLSNLWVAFSGHWPERGAGLETATDGALAAYTVWGRLPAEAPALVVASTADAAAAFGAVFSRRRTACVLLVPGRDLSSLRLREPLHPAVRLVALDGAGDRDVAAVADALARTPGFREEGGLRNVGRRDGLGTVLYAAYEAMGRLPDQVFQPADGGAGAVGLHEAARRFAAGRPDQAAPRLLLCRTAPLAPLPDPWRGGVGDALAASGGEVLAADDDEVRAARDAFQGIHAVDIEPAAGVALACLRAAANGGRVPRRAAVLLHVTGGRARLAAEGAQVQPEPDARFRLDQVPAGDAAAEIASRFAAPARPGLPAVESGR
jgi:cysteate synthase